MSISELKQDLIKNISSINDVLFLGKIKQFLEIGNLHQGIHVLTDEQRQRVLNSLEQYEKGNFMTSEEAEDDIKQWIEE